MTQAVADRPKKKVLKFKLRSGRFILPIRDEYGEVIREPLVKNGKQVLARDGKTPMEKIKRTTHVATDPRTNIIATTDDLVKRFGRGRFEALLDSATGLAPGQEVWDRNKETFEAFCKRVGQETPQPLSADEEAEVAAIKVPKGDQGVLETFKSMTVMELREQAVREEVDLSAARTKAEIIKVLMGLKK